MQLPNIMISELETRVREIYLNDAGLMSQNFKEAAQKIAERLGVKMHTVKAYISAAYHGFKSYGNHQAYYRKKRKTKEASKMQSRIHLLYDFPETRRKNILAQAGEETMPWDNERNDLIYKIVTQLEYKPRLIIEGLFFEGKTAAEVAKELEITEARMYVIRARALNRLKTKALALHLQDCLTPPRL